MAKSSRTGYRKSSGTVTVIEARVHRSAARHARVAYAVTLIVVMALTLVVASQWMRPALSFLLALVLGNVAGALAWMAVRIWTYARIVWWWLGEILTITTLFYLWSELVDHTTMPVLCIVVAIVFGALCVPNIRTRVVAIGWCFIVRHRLRTCFSQFIVSNQSGSLPLIFVARPTPVGERVWIYLRPGLSMSDLEARLEKIAVACHASAVLVERASTSTAGFVRVDIKRREVLGALVGSPLTNDMDPVDGSVPVSPAPAGISVDPSMDLPDTTTQASVVTAPTPAATPRTTPTVVPVKKVPVVLNGSGEDYSDWIS